MNNRSINTQDKFIAMVLTAGNPIYFNNFKKNYLRFFAEVFPVCAQVLGEQVFQRAVYEYTLENPQRTIVWQEYAAAFPVFLNRFQLPYLNDLAQLEYYQYLSNFSDQCGKDNFNELSKLREEEWGSLKIALHPGLFFFKTSYPVLEIWDRHHEVEPKDWRFDLFPTDRFIFVVRDWQGRFEQSYINEKEYELLQKLKAQKQLSEIGDDASLLQIFYKKNWLSHWFR